MKNIITDLKQTDCNEHKDRRSRGKMSDIEEKKMKNDEAKQRRERRKWNMRLDLQSVTSSNNIYIIKIPEESVKRVENLFEEMIAKSFPTLEKETDIQI